MSPAARSSSCTPASSAARPSRAPQDCCSPRASTRVSGPMCAERGQAFVRCSGLQGHQKTHSAEHRNRAAALATRAFRPRCSLRGEKPHECTECTKAFGLLSHLAEHRRRAHTGERPYGCPECGKTFQGCSELHQHERLHSGEKPCIRADCGRAFVRNCSLARPARAHRRAALRVRRLQPALQPPRVPAAARGRRVKPRLAHTASTGVPHLKLPRGLQ
ncbi:zinc finger protein 835-like [Balaenoptera ricei]|uniref:zinc finger protein 835-like n=1 Tax=Balaenoptera ricei TaxID=2746895 RepID=UPI0028BE6979|nr:zinc finger protein 835-like [Balaenoptera ricei]